MERKTRQKKALNVNCNNTPLFMSLYENIYLQIILKVWIRGSTVDEDIKCNIKIYIREASAFTFMTLEDLKHGMCL